MSALYYNTAQKDTSNFSRNSFVGVLF